MGLNCVRSISARLRINGEENIYLSRKQPSVFSGYPKAIKCLEEHVMVFLAAIFLIFVLPPEIMLSGESKNLLKNY